MGSFEKPALDVMGQRSAPNLANILGMLRSPSAAGALLTGAGPGNRSPRGAVGGGDSGQSTPVRGLPDASRLLMDLTVPTSYSPRSVKVGTGTVSVEAAGGKNDVERAPSLVRMQQQKSAKIDRGDSAVLAAMMVAEG